ncbi:hypothetical protein VTO42DRAFT_8184 [Malbranchea cinnamomea]
MSHYDNLYQSGLYLSPEQQDLLYAALSSSNRFAKGPQDDHATINPLNSNLHPPQQRQQQQQQQQHGVKQENGTSSNGNVFDSPSEEGIGSAKLGFGTDESPFLDFNLDADFDFNATDALIGELPGDPPADSESREKRKSIDGKQTEDNGKKRKENEEKTPKKPGRKPLTSEPTSKRKAQNRAAQRAFRERKEKHLRDLEAKVQELEKASQVANNENALLRAQVERLQIELREYRKRLSWISTGNSFSPSSGLYSGAGNSRNFSRLNNEFTFEFPKFGDLPNSQFFGNKAVSATSQKPSSWPLAASQHKASEAVGQDTFQDAKAGAMTGGLSSTSRQSLGNAQRLSHAHTNSGIHNGPSAATNSRSGTGSPNVSNHNGIDKTTNVNFSFPNMATFASNSPSSSSESHNGHASSIATSPEPAANSPPSVRNNSQTNSKNGENASAGVDSREQAFYRKMNEACGCVDNPIPAALARASEQSQASTSQKTTTDNIPEVPAFDWLAQQNGGQFDPVLFNDYREPQDAILSQDFGTFFDDAFPLSMGSPFQNFLQDNNTAPKTDLIGQIDSALAADDEVVPAEDKSQMLTCTKIWDRLQSLDKFRNGEIDVDSLCSELRTKARCSESGVVVDKKDLDDIVTRAA